MAKAKTAAPSPARQATGTAGELPLITPTQPQAHVGLLQPNIFNVPTHEELVALLFILGLTTRPYHGHDANGNLVSMDGNVIVPANLKRFFQAVPVQMQAPAEAAK